MAEIDENAKRYGEAWDGLMAAFKALAPDQQRRAAENLFHMAAGEVAALNSATKITGTHRVYPDGEGEFTFEMSTAPQRKPSIVQRHGGKVRGKSKR